MVSIVVRIPRTTLLNAQRGPGSGLAFVYTNGKPRRLQIGDYVYRRQGNDILGRFRCTGFEEATLRPTNDVGEKGSGWKVLLDNFEPTPSTGVTLSRVPKNHDRGIRYLDHGELW